VGTAIAVDGPVDGGGGVAEVTDQATSEGGDVVLAFAARDTVADEDQWPRSGGVGRGPQQPRDCPAVALDVETALTHAFGDDVFSGPVH